MSERKTEFGCSVKGWTSATLDFRMTAFRSPLAGAPSARGVGGAVLPINDCVEGSSGATSTLCEMFRRGPECTNKLKTFLDDGVVQTTTPELNAAGDPWTERALPTHGL